MLKASRSRSRSPRSSTRSVTSSHAQSSSTVGVKRYPMQAHSKPGGPHGFSAYNRPGQARPNMSGSQAPPASNSLSSTSSATGSRAEKDKDADVSSSKPWQASSGSRAEKDKDGDATTTKPWQSSASSTAATSVSTSAQSQAPTQPQPNRFACKIPRYHIDAASGNVALFKTRYPNLYVPSDFSNVRHQWAHSLPMHRPLKFASTRCLFHIMNKDAHSIAGPNEAVYEPADADYRWTVKVNCLSFPII